MRDQAGASPSESAQVSPVQRNPPPSSREKPAKRPVATVHTGIVGSGSSTPRQLLLIRLTDRFPSSSRASILAVLRHLAGFLVHAGLGAAAVPAVPAAASVTPRHSHLPQQLACTGCPGRTLKIRPPQLLSSQ
jgi:hypothetical protein